MVLEGEIVYVDDSGRLQFSDLLFHRRDPCFFAFDLLIHDGKDWRSESLLDRKRASPRVGTDSVAFYVEVCRSFGGFRDCTFRRGLPVGPRGHRRKIQIRSLSVERCSEHVVRDPQSQLFATGRA
jgi:hypothetical protein